MDMQNCGLTDDLAAEAARYPDLAVARVVSQGKRLYRVVNEAGEGMAAVSGRLRYEAVSVSDYPTVGDFVMLDGHPNAQKTGVIMAVLPRRSVFMRRAAGSSGDEQLVAANVDTLFVCMALNHDFNLRRLERYLAIAWDSGATPVVVLTKADICPQRQQRLLEAQSVSAGAAVLVCSALSEDGLSEIRPYLGSGRSIALIGSSGVGKSTLINRLMGEERLDTGAIRGDGKGRHTTTRRELLFLEDGGIVIDTPGMRELGLWALSDGLETGFSDIEALAASCRFRDCRHESEPGCAVRAALESGVLDEPRFLSYQKLLQESAQAAALASRRAQKEQKMKAISKINKAAKKK